MEEHRLKLVLLKEERDACRLEAGATLKREDLEVALAGEDYA